MNEIVSLRKETHKTFDLGNSLRVRQCHCKPIHYKNGIGVWEDIVLDFRDEPDKFISDKNKVSCAARKDKQLLKYFGLRYDDDHRLEFTLNRIDLDGIPQVTPAPFDLITKVSNHQLEHYLASGISIVSDLSEVALRTLVKVDSPIGDFSVTDEIHLKGLKVSNDQIGNEYIPDEYGRFNFTNKDTGELAFWINPPYFEEATGERRYNLEHSLKEVGIRLLYTKTPTAAGQDDLILAQYPILIDTNIYFSSTNDGEVAYSAADTWDEAHDAPTGQDVDTGAHSAQYAIMAESAKGKFKIQRSFFYYDTSDLGGATVTSAILKIYGYISADSYVSAQKGEQAATLTTADYDAFSGSEYGSVAWAIDQYNDITFNAQGRSDINTTGTTKICCRERTYDYLDSQPGATYENGCYFAEQSGTDKDPRLDIEYTPAAAPGLENKSANMAAKMIAGKLI